MVWGSNPGRGNRFFLAGWTYGFLMLNLLVRQVTVVFSRLIYRDNVLITIMSNLWSTVIFKESNCAYDKEDLWHIMDAGSVSGTELCLIKYVVQHVLWISGPGLIKSMLFCLWYFCFEANWKARPLSASFASLVFPVLLAFISKTGFWFNCYVMLVLTYKATFLQNVCLSFPELWCL